MKVSYLVSTKGLLTSDSDYAIVHYKANYFNRFLIEGTADGTDEIKDLLLCKFQRERCNTFNRLFAKYS